MSTTSRPARPPRRSAEASTSPRSIRYCCNPSVPLFSGTLCRRSRSTLILPARWPVSNLRSAAQETGGILSQSSSSPFRRTNPRRMPTIRGRSTAGCHSLGTALALLELPGVLAAGDNPMPLGLWEQDARGFAPARTSHQPVLVRILARRHVQCRIFGLSDNGQIRSLRRSTAIRCLLWRFWRQSLWAHRGTLRRERRSCKMSKLHWPPR
jgi:hypothetical protein